MCYSEWFKKSSEAEEMKKARKAVDELTKGATKPVQEEKSPSIPEKQPTKERDTVPV